MPSPVLLVELVAVGRFTFDPHFPRLHAWLKARRVPVTWLRFGLPPDVQFARDEFRDTIRASVEEVFRTGKPGLCEGPGWRLDEQEHWYAAYLGPIYHHGELVAVSVISINITERRLAADKLRESEAKYRRLHQSMRDAFVGVDMNGYIQECNQAYVDMLGYSPDELRTLRYGDITPERWRPVEAEIVQNQVLARGYSDIYEKEHRRKDGTVFPVELRTFLIADDEGRPRAMWAIVRDITDRKRAEDAVRRAHEDLELRVRQRTEELAKANESLDIFRKFAEASAEGFGISDLEGRIVYVNPALCRLLGETSPESIIGESIAKYYPEG